MPCSRADSSLSYLVLSLLAIGAFYAWRFTVWAADAGGYWNLMTGRRPPLHNVNDPAAIASAAASAAQSGSAAGASSAAGRVSGPSFHIGRAYWLKR